MSFFNIPWILVLVFVWTYFLCVDGNALLRPVSRGVKWTRSHHNPTSYNYMGVNCGGIGRFRRNDGQCGLCGDPYDGPRRHEFGGKYATGAITQTYPAGQTTIGVKILINANQGGYFEFRLCEANGKRETQACFDQHLLGIIEASAQGEIDRYYVERTGIIQLNLEIPVGLSCTQCILQWKYTTDNAWGRDALGRGCLGCGPQETFINCADIRIKGWNIVPTTAQLTTTTTTTTPPPLTTTTELPSTNQQPKTTRTTTTVNSSPTKQQYRSTSIYYTNTVSRKTDRDETRQVFTPAWTQSGHRSTDSAPKTPLDLHYQNSKSKQKSLEDPKRNKPRGPPPRPPPTPHPFIPRPPKLSPEHIKAANKGAKLHIHTSADKTAYIHVHSNPENRGQTAVPTWKPKTSPAPAMNNFYRENRHQASHVHGADHHGASIQHNLRSNPRGAKYDRNRWARPSMPTTPIPESMMNEYSVTASPKYTFRPVQGKDNSRPASWPNRNHRRTDTLGSHGHPSNPRHKGIQTGSRNTRMQHRDHNIRNMPRNTRNNLWYVPTTTPKPKRSDLRAPRRKDNQYSRYDMSYVPGLTKSPDIKKKFKPLSKTFFETPVQRKENNSRYADLGQLELMGVDLDSHGHPITTSTTSFPPGAYDRFPLAQAGVISPRQKELQSLINIRNRLKQDAEENRFRRPAVFERFTRFKVGKKGGTQKTENARMQSSGGYGVNDLSKPSKGPAYEQNPTIKIKSSVSSNMFNPFLSSIKTQPEVPAPNIHGVDFLRQKPLANEFTHTKHTNTLEKGHTGSDTHGQRDGHGHTQGQGHSPVIIIENTNTGHGHSPQGGGVLGLYAHNDTAQNTHNNRYGNIPTTPVPQFQQHHQQSHGHAGASNLNIPAHHDQAHGNMNKVVLPNIDPQAYLSAGAEVQSNRQMPMTETDIQRQAGQIFEKTAPPVFNGMFSNMPGQTFAKTGFNAVTQPPANQKQQAVIEAMKSSILESINKANHQMQGQNVEFQPLQHQHALVNQQTNVMPNWPQADQQTQQSQVMNTAVVNNVQPIPTMNNVQQMQTMNNFPQMPSYHQTQQTHLVNYAGANNVPLVPTINNIAQIPNTNSFPQKLYTNNVQQTPNMNNGQQMPNMNYDQQMQNINNAHQMPNLNNVQQMPHMDNGQHISNMNNGQQIPHMNTVQQFQYMNNGQQIPSVNNGQEISNMNHGQAMQNMNNDQQILYMNNGQQIPNMNNGQQIPNMNSFQQVQTMSNSQQMPNTKREISQQFQYQAVESQYQNSGAQNALPNVRNQNVFPNQAFQNPFHNQPIQTLPTDQGTQGIVQRQDFSQTNLNTANSLPNQGTDTSFQSQGPQNFYQNQGNGNPFSNELSKDLFQNQAQQNIQQGQGTHVTNENKRIKMVSLQHENIKHNNEGMPQHQNFNDHGVHLKNNIQNEEVANPAYDIKAATMRNVQAVNTISQGNIDHVVSTTTPPTSPSSTQSELFSIETASAKQLVMELRKLQALSKKGPLTYSQLQQRQALQIQLVKRIHEAQLKQLNKQNGTKPKKGNEKIPETSNGTGPTKHPAKSVLTQSQYQTPQQEHPSRHEAAGSTQQVNLEVNKYKHIQSNHHQQTIGHQKSTVTGHQHNQPNLSSENKHNIPNMAVDYKHNQNHMAVGQQQSQANIASEHQHNQPNMASEHQHNQPNMVSEHQHNQPNMASEHQYNQPNMVLEHQHNQPNMASEHQHNQPNMVSEHQHNQPDMVLDHQHNQPDIPLDHQHNEPNMAFEHQHHQPNVVAEHKHNVPNMAVEHQHSQKYTVPGSQHNQPNAVAKPEHNMPNTVIAHINNQANVAAGHSHSMPNMAFGQQQSQANSDHMHTNDHSHDINNLPVTSDVTAQTTITRHSAVSTATGTQSITNVNPAVTQKSAVKNRLNSFVDKLASRMNNKVSDTKAAGKLQNIQVSPVSREAIMKVLREMALEALRKRGKITENKMAVQNKPTLSAVEVDFGLTREAIKTKSTEPVRRITKRSTPTLYETGSTYRVPSPNGIQNAIRPRNEIATIPMNINKGPSDVLVPIERPTHIIYQPLDIPAHLMPNRFAHQNNNRPTHIVDHPSNGRPNIHESKAGRVSLPTTLPNQYQSMQDFQTSVRWGQPEFARWNPSTTAFIDPQITETIPQPQAQGFVPFETVTTPTDFTTQAMHHGKSHSSHNNVDIITNPHNVKEQINSRTISVTSATKNSYVPKINSDKKLTRQDITELGNEILQQMKKLILRQRG